MSLDNRFLFLLAAPFAAVVFFKTLAWFAGGRISESTSFGLALVVLLITAICAGISWVEDYSWGKTNLRFPKKDNAP